MSRFRRNLTGLRTGLTNAERKSGPVTIYRPLRGVLHKMGIRPDTFKVRLIKLK